MSTKRRTLTKKQSSQQRIQKLYLLRPRSADKLHHVVKGLLGMNVPRHAMVRGNDAPFDYLLHSFFGSDTSPSLQEAETGHTPEAAEDVVVWANRGGGKTMLGAVATLLDLVFKPGIEVCILGGSFEQSSKMYRYLLELFDRPHFQGILAGEPTQRRIELINGSIATVLTQSPRSVRGQRVQKIRCDELDEFERDVWQAAQLVTRAKQCGPVPVPGTIEVMSTCHRPFGLMNELISEPVNIGGMIGANTGTTSNSREKPSARVLRWCAMDVIERCPPERDCDTCLLWSDCQGRAKFADGFMHIDDLIAQRQRTDNATWSAEMMCRRPTTSDSVYPQFDPTAGGKHVMDVGPRSLKHELVAAVNSSKQYYPEERLLRQVLVDAGSRKDDPAHQLVGGMDFGLRNPLVMLWARIRPGEPSNNMGNASTHYSDPMNPYNQIIEIVDEHVEEGLTLDQNLAQIERRGWPKPDCVGVDPAGGQRSSQTGCSEIDLLRRRGYRVRAQCSRIIEGIKHVRRRLDQGTLRIAPHCEQLIQALASYHFDPKNPHSESPVKDGHDHACDALRYLIVNLETGTGSISGRRY